ncbi:hypothetical protein RclHR1_06250007 [Rhizophagus clarus]|uniref:Uncharacterized protein n=1 Tax=Rhizophagus clarus TaxID=94130 RepID=A0A2Z6S3N7_9GLOM|nr:hypothetical protein RclHR1_06250007 [Rhizophagus clarus]
MNENAYGSSKPQQLPNDNHATSQTLNLNQSKVNQIKQTNSLSAAPNVDGNKTLKGDVEVHRASAKRPASKSTKYSHVKSRYSIIPTANKAPHSKVEVYHGPTLVSTKRKNEDTPTGRNVRSRITYDFNKNGNKTVNYHDSDAKPASKHQQPLNDQKTKAISYSKVSKTNTLSVAPNIAHPTAKMNVKVHGSSTSMIRKPTNYSHNKRRYTPTSNFSQRMKTTPYLKVNQTNMISVAPPKDVEVHRGSAASKIRQPAKYSNIKGHYSQLFNIGQRIKTVPLKATQMNKTTTFTANKTMNVVHQEKSVSSNERTKGVTSTGRHSATQTDELGNFNNLCYQISHLQADLSVAQTAKAVAVADRTSLEVEEERLKIEYNTKFAKICQLEHDLACEHFNATNLLDQLENKRSEYSLLVQEKDDLIKNQAKFEELINKADQELDELAELLTNCDAQLKDVTKLLDEKVHINAALKSSVDELKKKIGDFQHCKK